MSENSSIEENIAGILLEVVEESPDIQTLTQEVVNKQIKGFIAPLTRQLEDLTRLVQKMMTIPNPRHYLSTDCGTSIRTTAYQFDK